MRPKAFAQRRAARVVRGKVSDERATFPIQAKARSHPAKGAVVNRHLYLAAYEVYSLVHGQHPALIEGGCRGGFSSGELIAFLYARSFPRAEWSRRVDEALIDMDLA